LKAEDVDQWLQHLLSPLYPKPKYRNSFVREVAALRTILNWYRERKNPRFQPPILKRHRGDAVFFKQPRGRKMPLTEAQLEMVLEWLKTHSQRKVYYYLAAFQALSGPRIGEACGLKWTDIDFDNHRYTIERIVWWEYHTKSPNLRAGTKTGDVRIVKLCPRLVQLLKEWKEIGAKGQFIFHKHGNLLRYPAIQNGYNKAFQALGLPHRSTHVFRHTFATLHADQTKDIRATQAALGHRDLRTTQHYASVSERTQEQALGDFRVGQVNPNVGPKGGLENDPCPANVPQQGGKVISLRKKA
jgi:integrase